MSEMNELFYRDSYCTEFDSTVVSCEKCEKGYACVLEDTAFYPEGGGQPCDLGTLNDIEVLDVRRDSEGRIVHTLREEVQGSVHGKIDWTRRFDHMQAHSGEHIVSGVIHSRFGYENVGFHMGDVIQIDFDGVLTQEEVWEIEREANAVIWKNAPIEVTFPCREKLNNLEYRSKKELQGTVRIVSIPSVDVCACCGTHVARTGEIGLIKIHSVQKHKSGVRLEMTCGRKALGWVCRIWEENRKVSQKLCAPITDTSDKVTQVMGASAEKDTRIAVYVRQYLETELQRISTGERLVVLFEKDAGRNEIRMFVNKLIEEKRAGCACVMTPAQDGSFAYILASKTLPLRSLVKELNARLNGRGGGSDEMVQGSFRSTKETIEETLKEVLHGEV